MSKLQGRFSPANALSRAPVASLWFCNHGGLLFANDNRRDLYDTGATYVNPRFGAAWTPAALGGKTVLRAGGGVFFFSIGKSGVNQTDSASRLRSYRR